MFNHSTSEIGIALHLAKLFETAETHNGGYEIENAVRGELGDGVAPPQEDQRTENLRQVLLNIKSRRAKA